MSSLLASLDLFSAESSWNYRVLQIWDLKLAWRQIFSAASSFMYTNFFYFIEWQPTWQLTLAYKKCIHYTLLACVTYSFFWIHLKEQIIDKWTWIVWFHMWHVAKSLFFSWSLIFESGIRLIPHITFITLINVNFNDFL